MRIAFTAAISLAALVLLAHLASAQTAQHDIVGAWDIFEDSCESGYLEYRADGADFAAALALSQRPMTDFIDLESIISKLHQIMLMTMGGQ